MEATEPMTEEMAVESILMPEQAEEVEAEDTETEEAPVEDEQTDEDEVEAENDDADEQDDPDEAEQDDDDEENDDADEEPQSFTVKVDGQEKSVTLDELKRGYAGQAYIQKGMQEAADAKKQAEAEFQQAQSERAQIAQVIAQMQQGQVIPAPQAPTREMLESDPIGYMAAKAQYDEEVAAYQHQQAQFAYIQQQQAQADERSRQEMLARERELLLEAIPELGDANKAPTMRKAIVETGEAYGFTAEELGQVVDHRAMKVINDARKWRELQASKPAVEAKAKKARPAVKTKAKNKAGPARKAREAAQKRLRESGDINDAVSLIMEMPERT